MDSKSQSVVDAFHDLYYNGLPGEGEIFSRTRWMGVPCAKCPLDLWIYQEIMARVKPDLIVETGTYMGGSALYMAHMMDLLGTGEIVTIDIVSCETRPVHPRIRYVTGSSTDVSLIERLFKNRPAGKCMIILDSDHTKDHVARELKLLSPYVSVGSYLIVEDTNINGHPTFPRFGPGPYEATQEFLRATPDFQLDLECEKFLMTFNPHGYMKRVK